MLLTARLKCILLMWCHRKILSEYLTYEIIFVVEAHLIVVSLLVSYWNSRHLITDTFRHYGMSVSCCSNYMLRLICSHHHASIEGTIRILSVEMLCADY